MTGYIKTGQFHNAAAEIEYRRRAGPRKEETMNNDISFTQKQS